MRSRITAFAFASLIPAVLLALGGVYGTVWLWAALTYMTVLTFGFDMFSGEPPETGIAEEAVQFDDILLIVLALTHFVLLLIAIQVVSGVSGHDPGGRILGFFAFGLFFGQVSNSNAHELIHRQTRALHWLGAWVFISQLFGHHTSAHRLVHHRYVATPTDPSSAPIGMSFYRFIVYAWRGSFMSGWRAENSLRNRGGGRIHPYFIYISGAVIWFGIAALIGGLSGVIAFLTLAGYATTQLLVSDYVQHYGLRRLVGVDGKPEPVGLMHSWNSPHWFSSLVMLNAPRHSDHHNNPMRKYPDLQLERSSPMLPYSLPIMGGIAFLPSSWRKLMDHRVAQINDQTGAEQ